MSRIEITPNHCFITRVALSSDYNTFGQLTATRTNHVNGNPDGGAGIDDVKTSYGYDAFGRVTTTTANDGGGAAQARTVTAYDTLGRTTYDLGDKLTGINPTGTADDVTFTFDALGRFRTRVLATSTDTYSYAGTSEVVQRIANSAGTTTDSIVSPSGDRLGVSQGNTVNWFVPDLHGNVAASLNATEASVTNATRYDPYGQTIATGTASGAPSPVGETAWKYQGRLDISPAGISTPLYDMSARFHPPGLGTFT